MREGQIWCRVELRGGSDTIGLLGTQHPESRGRGRDEDVSIGLEIDERCFELHRERQHGIGGQRVELDAVLTALFAGPARCEGCVYARERSVSTYKSATTGRLLKNGSDSSSGSVGLGKGCVVFAS